VHTVPEELHLKVSNASWDAVSGGHGIKGQVVTAMLSANCKDGVQFLDALRQVPCGQGGQGKRENRQPTDPVDKKVQFN